MPPSERRKKITIQAGQICPLCREKVHRAEVLAVCPGCNAVYHRDCSGELASGRCTTLGCRYSQRRTASGRRPSAPVRDERPQRPPRPSLSSSERILRGATACGVTVAFLFLAIHVSESIEANTTKQKRAKRHARQAKQVRQILDTYRLRSTSLRALAGRTPPASWRFPSGRFNFDDRVDGTDAAVVSWRQLTEPQAPSPLPEYFPHGFREGLALSAKSPSSPGFPKPWALNPRVKRAMFTRFVVAVRIHSLRPAESLVVGSDGSVRPSWSQRPMSRVEAHANGTWPVGMPPQAQAQVVLRAYLFDLESDPSYKGCLEVRGQGAIQPGRVVDPITGFPLPSASNARRAGGQVALLLAELRAEGLEPGRSYHADVAALQNAYLELRRELRITSQ